MITIPANTTLIGELRSSGRIRIDGHIEGNGVIDGLLLLTSSCVWKGQLTADVVIVEGTVEGDIIARRKLELQSSANVNGVVTSPEISIAAGAKVTGEFRMHAPDAPIGLIENKADSEGDAESSSTETHRKRVIGE